MTTLNMDFDVSADLTTVYEGGELSKITVDELLNNKVAIKQLVNQHNYKMLEIKNKQIELSEYVAENKFHNASPFPTTLAAFFAVLGSIVIALGVNNLDIKIGWPLIIVGAIMVLVSSLSNIFRKYIYNWFNKSGGEKNAYGSIRQY